MTTYMPKRNPVEAVQWTGAEGNFEEVEQFTRDFIGDPDEIGLRHEVDEYTRADGSAARFDILQFDAWGDDQEADPGSWIVVHTDIPDHDDRRRGEILTDEAFRDQYEEAKK